jgi:hypothetical protein
MKAGSRLDAPTEIALRTQTVVCPSTGWSVPAGLDAPPPAPATAPFIASVPRRGLLVLWYAHADGEAVRAVTRVSARAMGSRGCATTSTHPMSWPRCAASSTCLSARARAPSDGFPSVTSISGTIRKRSRYSACGHVVRGGLLRGAVFVY